MPQLAPFMFPLYALFHFVLLIWAVRLTITTRQPGPLLLCVILAALVYDNTVISVGNLVGVGPVLATLNMARFVMHSLFSPLLIIIAVEAARQAGTAWANRSRVRLVFNLITLIFSAVWLFSDLFLVLKPQPIGDLMRYTTERNLTPAWVTGLMVGFLVIINLVVIVAGGAVWRNRKWPWLFFGALLMLIIGAIPNTLDFTPILSNGGEAVLGLALVTTGYKLRPFGQPQEEEIAVAA